MRESTAEMDYTPQEELIPGREVEGNFPVMVDLLEPNPEIPYHEALADYITERALELKNEGFDYRDMVILMQKVSSDAPKLVETLTARNVPVFFDGGAAFYTLDEVQSFLRLLELMQNPYQDLPLISSLRNPPFMFTEQEMAEIRLCASGKIPFWQAFDMCAVRDTEVGKRCAAAKQKLDEWRELSKIMPLGTFLFHLAGDSMHYAMAGASPAGHTAQKNIRLLCMQADAVQDAGIYTIRDFLSFAADQASGGDTRAAAPLAENDNVIRIMTMHKSKGLQFPVVFCLGLDKGMKGRQEASVLVDAELGIALRYKEPKQRISRKTAADEIFAWKKEREERAERIRLLYVAMTRAQKRMFLTGITEDRLNWQLPSGEHRVQSARDFLDWIVPALRDAEKLSTGCAHLSTHWKIRTLGINQQKNVENAPVIHNLENWLNSLLSQTPVDGLWKESFEEEENPDRMIKRSVTAIIRKAEQEAFGPEDQEETPEEKRIPERFSRALRKYDMSRLPPFMTVPPEKQGAWRGTVTHRFLSLVDLERVRGAGASLEQEIIRMRDEMKSSGILRDEEADVIDAADVAGFFSSDIGRRMLASPEIHREWGFNLFREEENLLVQGVIDCAFLEGGDWILLDYKTDRIEDPEAFCDEYRPQLAWYAAALETLTGRKVREKCLYALSTGQVFPV
jgi:ATP-dependent helicase/nuclease subunit A